MSLDVIVVQKSLDERFSLYANLFTESYEISACDVKSIWSNYMEFSFTNSEKWQALWKIPRIECENLNIDFPTVVCVEVEEVDLYELSARITIIAVQDEVDLPEQYNAMLIHLFPTLQQRNQSIDIQTIAQSLDELRFFFNNMWQPWDEDERIEDWVMSCLQPRMKLFSDMQDGVLDNRIVSHIRKSLEGARSLHKHKLFLEMKLQNLKCVMTEDCFDNAEEKNIAVELLELKPKWDKIRQEIEMIENPLLRNAVIERYQKGELPSCELDVKKYFLVWNGGTFKEYCALMTAVQTLVPQDARIQPCDLKTSLSFMEQNDAVFLCRGMYKISDILLKKSGVFKGFPSSSDVILTSQSPSSCIMDCRNTKLVFSDITFSGDVSPALVVVHSGFLKGENCQFCSNYKRRFTTGIIIMTGGSVELVNCDLTGLDTGLSIKAGAKLSLEKCRISRCAIGIEICDGAEVVLKDCLLEDCSGYGFVLQTDKDIPDTVGSLQLFERCESIVVKNTRTQDNILGDVLLSSASCK